LASVALSVQPVRAEALDQHAFHAVRLVVQQELLPAATDRAEAEPPGCAIADLALNDDVDEGLVERGSLRAPPWSAVGGNGEPQHRSFLRSDPDLALVERSQR